MKTRLLLTMALLAVVTAASAQIQLLYMDGGRNVIDRTKKLYWMDGDDDPCYSILNYKKTGNKETFSLKPKENARGQYKVTMTLDAKGTPTEITLTSSDGGSMKSAVKTTSGRPERDEELYNYFGRLAGYPAKVSVASSTSNVSSSVPNATTGVPSAADVQKDGVKGTANKIGDAAKGAFGKVKGLFKKKK